MLCIRGEQSRARKLAARMKDRKFAARFLNCARFTLWPTVSERVIIQATPCDIANDYGLHGTFVEADALIEQNKMCERLLRGHSSVRRRPNGRGAPAPWYARTARFDLWTGAVGGPSGE